MQFVINGQNYDAEANVSGVLDSTGNFFPLDSCAQTITKDGSGNVIYIDAVFNGVTWRQTFGYPNGTTTTISAWVKQ